MARNTILLIIAKGKLIMGLLSRMAGTSGELGLGIEETRPAVQTRKSKLVL